MQYLTTVMKGVTVVFITVVVVAGLFLGGCSVTKMSGEAKNIKGEVRTIKTSGETTMWLDNSSITIMDTK